LYCVEVGSVADVSDVRYVSLFSVEVCMVSQCSCIDRFWFNGASEREKLGNGPFARPGTKNDCAGEDQQR
jgi:hypothetical protein